MSGLLNLFLKMILVAKYNTSLKYEKTYWEEYSCTF